MKVLLKASLLKNEGIIPFHFWEEYDKKLGESVHFIAESVGNEQELKQWEVAHVGLIITQGAIVCWLLRWVAQSAEQRTWEAACVRECVPLQIFLVIALHFIF